MASDAEVESAAGTGRSVFGDALLRFVSDVLVEQRIEHAVTGPAAAWALTRFAAFRIATLYSPTDPSPALLEQLGCCKDPRGANLWLTVPKDAGVFQGAVEKGGIRCVHPAQVYVDLKDQPERATDVAEHLRRKISLEIGFQLGQSVKMNIMGVASCSKVSVSP